MFSEVFFSGLLLKLIGILTVDNPLCTTKGSKINLKKSIWHSRTKKLQEQKKTSHIILILGNCADCPQNSLASSCDGQDLGCITDSLALSSGILQQLCCIVTMRCWERALTSGV